MVQTCCIKSCNVRQKRGANISFHHFPKDPELKQQWIRAIKDNNFEPSPHSRVCSKHFASDCFVQSAWSSKQKLRADAIPNVSDVPAPQHMNETDILNVPCIKTENETPSLNNEFEETDILNVPCIKTENETASLNNEFEGTDILTVPCIKTENKSASLNNELEDTVSSEEQNVSLAGPSKKKRKAYVGDFKQCDLLSEKENYIQVIKRTITKKNKQIKTLKQTNRRLIQKIDDLHSLVDDLRKKHMITEDVSILLLKSTRNQGNRTGRASEKFCLS